MSEIHLTNDCQVYDYNVGRNYKCHLCPMINAELIEVHAELMILGSDITYMERGWSNCGIRCNEGFHKKVRR